MRVLIIEDDNILRAQIADDLKENGFTVDLAACRT